MSLRSILASEGLARKAADPLSVIESLAGKGISSGERINIEGYPVDIQDNNGDIELFAVDAAASKALLKIFRQKGLRPKFDKIDKSIYF